MRNDGKKFELLVHNIQKQLAPNAIVTHNESIVGKSGTPSQVDVVLRGSIGQYNFFCILECKDWSEKVGIETVRGFHGKMLDVSAMQGVMVSRLGYTEPAEKYAKVNNIIIYTLVNAEELNWKEVPLVPTAICRIDLGQAELGLIDKNGENIWLVDKDGLRAPEEKVYLLDTTTRKYIKVREFLERSWDEIFAIREPDPSEWFEIPEGKYLLYEGDKKHVPITVKYSLAANKSWYYGHISLDKGYGLLDQETKKFLPTEYTSKIFSFQEAVSNWPKVDSLNEVPITPEHIFLLGKFFYARGDKPIRNIIIERVAE